MSIMSIPVTAKLRHFLDLYTVGGMLMVEIFSIAKSLPLTKLFYLEKISMAKSLHIMNLSAVGDKMMQTMIRYRCQAIACLDLVERGISQDYVAEMK